MWNLEWLFIWVPWFVGLVLKWWASFGIDSEICLLVPNIWLWLGFWIHDPELRCACAACKSRISSSGKETDYFVSSLVFMHRCKEVLCATLMVIRQFILSKFSDRTTDTLQLNPILLINILTFLLILLAFWGLCNVQLRQTCSWIGIFCHIFTYRVLCFELLIICIVFVVLWSLLEANMCVSWLPSLWSYWNFLIIFHFGSV